MKRIIAIVLAALMCVAIFASCAKEEENKLVCGVTIFENMNEKDENGNWTGFETEFAQEVGKILGMEVEFQEIDWSQKYTELSSGAINCIWNGFTANSADDDGIQRKDKVDFSYGYMLNQQCIVINKKNAETIKSAGDLAGKTAGVEGGSAGHTYAKSVVGDGKIEEYPAQNKAFLEVKSGAVDFAVMDIVLAQNVCGKGDYSDLMIVKDIVLESEVYAVGFEKDSELTEKVNAAIKELFENGTMEKLAKKYGFENTVQLVEEIDF